MSSSFVDLRVVESSAFIAAPLAGLTLAQFGADVIRVDMIGGGIDYGRLLNPPRFIIPQVVGPNTIYQLPQDHVHFRFSQAF